jgi:hypothetical protein
MELSTWMTEPDPRSSVYSIALAAFLVKRTLKQIFTQFLQANSVGNMETMTIILFGGPDRTRTGDLLHVKQMS